MNGTHVEKPLNRADEVEHLIDAVKAPVVPFIRVADEAVPSRAAGELLPNSQGLVQNALVNARRPENLVQELALSLPKGEGRGEQGLLGAIQDVLNYSVNTWDQGFMDKLYASTNPESSVQRRWSALYSTPTPSLRSAWKNSTGR